MKRITEKRLNEFIAKVADIKPSRISDDGAKCYYSKIDGSYISREGMEDIFKMLLKKGITEQIQSAHDSGKVASLGFNPEEQKWYGWSHRAIYGFGIGSECKKGHCHYKAANKSDFMSERNTFWHDKHHEDTTSKEETVDGVKGVRTTWTYKSTVPNEKLRGTINGIFTEYPKKFGKGEWTAKTMEEAKQMAIDFANGVS